MRFFIFCLFFGYSVFYVYYGARITYITALECHIYAIYKSVLRIDWRGGRGGRGRQVLVCISYIDVVNLWQPHCGSVRTYDTYHFYLPLWLDGKRTRLLICKNDNTMVACTHERMNEAWRCLVARLACSYHTYWKNVIAAAAQPHSNIQQWFLCWCSLATTELVSLSSTAVGLKDGNTDTAVGAECRRVRTV